MATFVISILSLFQVSSINVKGDNHDPQSMTELLENFGFESAIPFTWEEYCEERDKVYVEYALRELRRLRDIELTQTDWVELPSNRETISNLDELLNYRQSLRDITMNLELGDFIWNISPGAVPRATFPRLTVLTRPKVIRKLVVQPSAEPASQTQQ